MKAFLIIIVLHAGSSSQSVIPQANIETCKAEAGLAKLSIELQAKYYITVVAECVTGDHP